MNKRFMVAGVAFLMLGLGSVVETQSAESKEAVEEVAETPAFSAFEAGEFLTEDDFGHVSDALGYLNLTPEDMQYEKKHLDHRFRLPAVNAALDNPMGLPLVAEGAAEDFRGINPPTSRTLAAGKLLGLNEFAWSAEGLRAATKEYGELIKKHYEAKWDADAAEKAGDEDRAALLLLKSDKFKEDWLKIEAKALFGGFAKLHGDGLRRVAEGLVAGAVLGRRFSSIAQTLWAGTQPDEAELLELASQLPSTFSDDDVAIPGVEPKQPSAAILEVAAKCDIASYLVAGARLSAVLERLKADASKHLLHMDVYEPIKPKIPGVTGDVMLAAEGPNGWYVIGGTGPNTYSGDKFIGIIDLGGDDVYRGRVAAGIGLPNQPAFSFVLDLGGNDQYLGEDFTQGFGFNGVGILHDLGKGNDVYRSRNYSQGAGLCGYGELYDDGGDDIYTADSFTQGAGSFGYGQLLDSSGNDIYRACRYAQAFAQVMGVGVLTDSGGNDTYYAGGKYLHQPLFDDRYQSLSQGFAIGNRRWGETGGGVALLLDEGDGNDTYTADIFGQGSSYWYALGMLVDKGGNDVYTLGQYGQGAGIHLSSGILVDLKGDDAYTNPYGVGTGGAHDWSVGWLIDREGNDTYTGNGQGQGLNFSTGVLLDCAGNDTHISSSKGSIGKGSNNSISLMIDLDGTDTYGLKELADNTVTQRGAGGIVYDCYAGWFVGVDESTLPVPLKEPADQTTVQQILIKYASKTNRDATRTKEEAAALLKQVLKQARTQGSDWAELQKTYNEDSGGAQDYVVAADSQYLPSFKQAALSIGVGQISVAETRFGLHIIKRTE